METRELIAYAMIAIILFSAIAAWLHLTRARRAETRAFKRVSAQRREQAKVRRRIEA
jgi:uncharacterized membrane protein